MELTVTSKEAKKEARTSKIIFHYQQIFPQNIL
jgi:hypothetical protein